MEQNSSNEKKDVFRPGHLRQLSRQFDHVSSQKRVAYCHVVVTLLWHRGLTSHKSPDTLSNSCCRDSIKTKRKNRGTWSLVQSTN